MELIHDSGSWQRLCVCDCKMWGSSGICARADEMMMPLSCLRLTAAFLCSVITFGVLQRGWHDGDEENSTVTKNRSRSKPKKSGSDDDNEEEEEEDGILVDNNLCLSNLLCKKMKVTQPVKAKIRILARTGSQCGGWCWWWKQRRWRWVKHLEN